MYLLAVPQVLLKVIPQALQGHQRTSACYERGWIELQHGRGVRIKVHGIRGGGVLDAKNGVIHAYGQ